eukprot:4115502-Alexandrium_andersonii.AAC.1
MPADWQPATHGWARLESPCEPPAYGRAGGRQARVCSEDPPGVHDQALPGSVGTRCQFPPRASGLGIATAGTLRV